LIKTVTVDEAAIHWLRQCAGGELRRNRGQRSVVFFGTGEVSRFLLAQVADQRA
jgi:hypothetical protein